MNNITFPSSAKSLLTGAQDFAEQANEQAQGQAGKLNALSEPFHTPSAIADDAASVAALRDELNTLLVSGYSLAINPYQYRADDDEFLSPGAAANIAADKLTASDVPALGAHGLALVVSASTESVFAQSVLDLVSVMPFPDWRTLADRASKSAVLDLEKMQIPTVRRGPFWLRDNLAQQVPLSSTEQLIGAMIARAEAVGESNTSPVERLKALAKMSADNLTQLAASADALTALFAGSCRALKLMGTPVSMAKQLREADWTGEPFSALFLMVCDTEPTYFYQMVNV